LSPVALAAAATLLVVIATMKVLRMWWVPVYPFLGTAFWFSVLLSGVNATIAGVVLGLMTPAHALDPSSMRRWHLTPGRSVLEPRPSEVRPAA